MNTTELTTWQKIGSRHQIIHFKLARKALKLTQKELGERLKVYGYKGGVSTVKKWEQGLIKIPVLVYELIFEGFAERKK